MGTKFVVVERDEKYLKDFKETYGHAVRWMDARTFECDSGSDWASFHGIEEISNVAKAQAEIDADIAQFLSQYNGSNEFVKSVQSQYGMGRRLSPKQMEAIRKFLSYEQSPKVAPDLDKALRSYSGTSNFINSIRDQHLAGRTLSEKQIAAVSKSLLQVLTSIEAPKKQFSLNTGDYIVVSRFMAQKIGEASGLSRPHYGLEILTVHHETEKAWLVDAKLSAKKTCVCCVCGITLTNPESRARGIGPICAEKAGVNYTEQGVQELEEKLVAYKVTKVWIAKKCVKEINGEAPQLAA